MNAANGISDEPDVCDTENRANIPEITTTKNIFFFLSGLFPLLPLLSVVCDTMVKIRNAPLVEGEANTNSDAEPVQQLQHCAAYCPTRIKRRQCHKAAPAYPNGNVRRELSQYSSRYSFNEYSQLSS